MNTTSVAYAMGEVGSEDGLPILSEVWLILGFVFIIGRMLFVRV